MSPEAFCPEHGPYDASLGACPYPHSGSPRPGSPSSLDDDLPTDFGSGGGTLPTQPPGGYDDEGATEIPQSRQGRGILNYDEEDETELPRSRRNGGDDVTELDEPAKDVLAMLWVKEGARRGKVYPLGHNTVVGRKANRPGDIILDDPKVTSAHAKFTMEGNDFLIWDLASANGTYVNNKKIRGATSLEENDLVKIGETLFVIKLLEPKTKKKTVRASADSKKSKK